MNVPSRCENCGELAKESDIICWHCGQPLPGREMEVADGVELRSGRKQSVSAGTVGFYLAITLLVVTAALVIMGSLGERPQVQIGFGTRVPDGWIIITDRDETFTAYLPDSWITVDGGKPEESTELTDLLANVPAYSMGIAPLGRVVDDVEPFFVAYLPSDATNAAPLFLIVARSARLNRLSYNEARSFLVEEEPTVREIQFVDNFDKSHLRIVAEPVAAGNAYSLSCWQQFVRGLNFALLAATCTTLERDADQIPAFNTIHSSFQRLAS
jgi:hypothetical protein